MPITAGSFAERSLPPNFRRHRQEDSCEYIRHVLGALHTEELDMRKADSREADADNTIIGRNFQIKLKRTFKGRECQHEIHDLESCYEIHLPIISPQKSSREIRIKEQLITFFEPSYMCGEDAITCRTCAKKKSFEIITSVVRAPQYLMLSLDRFGFDAETRLKQKCGAPIDFPCIINLPVEENQYGHKKVRYCLTAVLFHSGDAYRGHYFTCGRHSSSVASNAWYKLNDSHMSPIEFEKICRFAAPTTAQKLVYTRQK
jgi:ubiquitin C-terminal hydrolase